jgi:hypothetical protein
MRGPEDDRAYLSLFNVPTMQLVERHPNWEHDTSLERIAILRSVLMKPEHRSYVPELMRRLNHHLSLKNT